MSTFAVAFRSPVDLRELGYSDKEIRRDVPVLLVLKRFRQVDVSSGKAASLLGMSRRDFLVLLASEGIPLFDPTDADLDKEIETARRLGVAS